MMNNPEMFNIYIADMNDHLELLNESLLKMDKNYDDKAIINDIFRSFHSMKGSTATMGFVHSAEIIHRMEDLLQGMREGRIIADPTILQLLFACHDFVENVIQVISSTGTEDGIEQGNLLDELTHYNPQNSSDSHSEKISLVNAGVHREECVVGPAELEYIRRKVSAGYKPYWVGMSVVADCQFKAVRGWMAFEALEQVAEIIKSSPAKPTMGEFSENSFVNDNYNIKAIVISSKDSDEIVNELESTLMEMEQLRVDEYQLGEATGITDVDRIIEGETFSTHGEPLAQDTERFVGEIRNHVTQAECYCLDAVSDSKNMSAISSLWRSFHVIKGLAGYISNSVIYTIAAETEKILDDCRKKKKKAKLDENRLNLLVESLTYIKEICGNESLSSDNDFLYLVDQHLGMLSASIASKIGKNQPDDIESKQNGLMIGEILVQKGVMNQEKVNELIDKQERDYHGLKFGKVVLKEETASLKDVVEALNVQQGTKVETKDQSSFIRVSEQKVDSLVNMLGELLIIQSLNKQDIIDGMAKMSMSDSRLINNIVRMERITKEIQGISMSLRMVSLKQSFQKLLRIGRDTAVELKKDVNIEMIGEETEIDRSAVEKIQDPLMHLVRNAISHGIEESEEKRIEHGKPAQGQVSIHAYNKRGFVFIEVGDDGKGLQLEKIYKKAREKNLIDPNKNYSDDEIIRFVFLPGFSTQEIINSISGRGVGMNVVETEIVKMGGKIEIANRPGNGCTFILKIPINLATINGTIVDLFNGRYILPTLSIKQILKPDVAQWVNIMGKTAAVKVRDQVIPLLPIDKILEIDDHGIDYKAGIVIVIEMEGELKALPASMVLGKQEVVVKPLGFEFRGLDFASGATILGDGRVSVILDIEALFNTESQIN